LTEVAETIYPFLQKSRAAGLLGSHQRKGEWFAGTAILIVLSRDDLIPLTLIPSLLTQSWGREFASAEQGFL